jgi:hypothetical protein
MQGPLGLLLLLLLTLSSCRVSSVSSCPTSRPVLPLLQQQLVRAWLMVTA